MLPAQRLPAAQPGATADLRGEALQRIALRLPPLPGPAEPDPFDAISAAADLETRLRDPASPGGLAALVLDFVAPPQTSIGSAGRLLGLLELAAEMLRGAPTDDDIAQLGAEALTREMAAHRDISARRGGLLTS